MNQQESIFTFFTGDYASHNDPDFRPDFTRPEPTADDIRICRGASTSLSSGSRGHGACPALQTRYLTPIFVSQSQNVFLPVQIQKDGVLFPHTLLSSHDFIVESD